MFHSIIVANGVQEVRRAVRDFQLAGRGVDQIQILAHERAEAEMLVQPRYQSRIGFVRESMAHTVTPVFKCSGDALKEKLQGLGLSPSAVSYYAQEMAHGRIVIAVDERVILHPQESVTAAAIPASL